MSHLGGFKNAITQVNAHDPELVPMDKKKSKRPSGSQVKEAFDRALLEIVQSPKKSSTPVSHAKASSSTKVECGVFGVKHKAAEFRFSAYEKQLTNFCSNLQRQGKNSEAAMLLTLMKALDSHRPMSVEDVNSIYKKLGDGIVPRFLIRG